ncbi:hypothetical protein WAI453_005425 [Rhynchosporium graminicola]
MINAAFELFKGSFGIISVLTPGNGSEVTNALFTMTSVISLVMGSSSEHSTLVNAIVAPTSFMMISIRARGRFGSIGTQAPPAFNTATCETTAHIDFPKQSGTGISLPTPSCRKCTATQEETSSRSE